MPGFSLWLVPPEHSAVYHALSTLIADTLPAQFPADSPPKFVPHVTLTSDIPSEAFSQASDDEQQERDARSWLDGLALPAGRDVKVQFHALDVGEKFVKKLTLRVRQDGVQELASISRLHGVEKGRNKEAVETWLTESYQPHCSLVYGTMPISGQKKAELHSLIERNGISVDGSGEMGGWEGGVVWLVPTFLEIPKWQPWVTRPL